MKKNIKSSFRRIRAPLSILPFFWLLVACGSPPDTAGGQTLLITLETSKDLNPDRQGKANPVRVTLYQLKQSEAFTMRDYFTLQDASDAELMAQIKKNAAYIMVPGEKKALTLKIDEETQALGVITAYHDIDNAQWRAVYTIPPPPRERWYRKWWPGKNRAQPEVMVRMEHLTTSIEKVE